MAYLYTRSIILMLITIHRNGAAEGSGHNNEAQGPLWPTRANGVSVPAGRHQCFFCNDYLYVSSRRSGPPPIRRFGPGALNRMNIDLLKRIYLFHAPSQRSTASGFASDLPRSYGTKLVHTRHFGLDILGLEGDQTVNSVQ